jgi:aryl-alcohol dehydrogenase-like predicted oxidoreductase
MNLSHAYSAPPPRDVAERVLQTALDHGVTHFDSAALYGFGANEELVGPLIGLHRPQVILASKCGIFRNAAGVREIDARPEVLKRTCDDSLRRLKTGVIDLYYLHRKDPRVPIEDSIGALADLVREGKVQAIGVSEVSAETVRRAHAVHPLAAVQSEYSLWTRNPEIAVLDACRGLGIAFVAFSPLARSFLCGALRDPTAELEPRDIRRAMPRFSPEHFPRNRRLLEAYKKIAREAGCTPPQLALAWLLAKQPFILPIPGTSLPSHVIENSDAAGIALAPGLVERLDVLINERTVSGDRYSETTQQEIDTENFTPV